MNMIIRVRMGALRLLRARLTAGSFWSTVPPSSERGDDTVRNPHRAHIYRFELSELIPLSKLDEQFPVERFEAAVSQSTVPSPPLVDSEWLFFLIDACALSLLSLLMILIINELYYAALLLGSQGREHRHAHGEAAADARPAAPQPEVALIVVT